MIESCWSAAVKTHQRQEKGEIPPPLSHCEVAGLNKTTKKSSEQEVLPTFILNMPSFSARPKVKDARLLYWTATATLAIEEGIPFCTFSQPSFRCLFIPLNSEFKNNVGLNQAEVRASVLKMGRFAIEAMKKEICNHQIVWTSDHWTGPDKVTYTTATAH
jgi:hypothetical protein